MRDFPARAWLYTGAVALASALGSFALTRSATISLGTTLGFGVLFVVAQAVPVKLTHVSYSVGYLVAICCVIAAGPATASVAAAFAALDLDLRRRPDWAGCLLFNAGQFSLSTLVMGVVYRATGGTSGALADIRFPHALLPVALATGAFFVANTLLVSAMVHLVRRVPWRDVLFSDYRTALASYFSLAALGILLAVLYLKISWAAVPFVVMPLVAARHAFLTAKRARDQFEATLHSLVTALEAKDPYTRGHAERVSRLSEAVALAHGYSKSKAQRVRYAALMHDVGKVTVDTRVLQKPGKLTPEEYDHMKVHSQRGAEIIAEIDLLADMVDGVRHHHERMDGRGYPDGLAGEQLSEVARMIMVADAFDSMTSTRSYRKAMPMANALAELRRCEGVQFSGEMIDSLERAIDRWGWEPAPEAYAGEQTARPQTAVHGEFAAKRPVVAG